MIAGDQLHELLLQVPRVCDSAKGLHQRIVELEWALRRETEARLQSEERWHKDFDTMRKKLEGEVACVSG
jgi:hypothetical protein